ncbi:type IV pilus biogenesis/stability protein PilW [Chromobacterium sp. IIBBL 290-4]|uniref:type IV pilus biogenesis/stability protein PilW n=1 Tax=Chromobacterium sp. IIBBL 290-4 TaxID=2953890 RepID=UPI0020B6C65D|nr:type IV pilus biogenesis/stability protein PilW [Chromobacterium sp. IIBBL 290-4]UTH72561.1 type IV pilus biogenesis/stability protein PilW [Chromobacterium sp. IIBBL 290-4]
MAFSASAPAAAGNAQDLARIRSQLAVEYAKIGNLKVALDNANQAVQADPTLVSAYLTRAYVLNLLQQSGPAEEDFQRALRLDPASPEVNNNYGLFLCEHGKPQESLAWFQKALANPLYDSPQSAYLNLGRCSAKLGRQEQANDYLLSALRAAPEYAPALRELANLQLEQGNARLAAFYFGRLRRAASSALDAADWWLGARIARKAGDDALESECANVLKNQYPDSRETQLLLSGS